VVRPNMSLMGKRHAPGEGLLRNDADDGSGRPETPLDLWYGARARRRRDGRRRRGIPNYTEALHPEPPSQVPAVFGAVLYREVPDVRRPTCSQHSRCLSDKEGETYRGRYRKTYLLSIRRASSRSADTFPTPYDCGRRTPGPKFTQESRVKAVALGEHKITVHSSATRRVPRVREQDDACGSRPICW